MKKAKLIVVLAAMSFATGAAAQSVPGEKLDSGLGKLSLKYTAQEFMPKDRVLGESLDNGLGQLGPSYTAWEFMPEGRILGESLDSGLGSLSREDLETYIRTPAMQRTALDSK
jgi:hypothetical protein